MSDYISRDSIRQKLWNKSYTDPNDATEVCGIINIEPSADVRENVHGEWELCEDQDGLYGVCSKCGTDADFQHYGVPYPFCPNCGADMRGGK